MKSYEQARPTTSAHSSKVDRAAAIIRRMRSHPEDHVHTPSSDLAAKRLGVAAATEALAEQTQAIEQEKNLSDQNQN